MMEIFNTVINKGRVYCKLSIISIMSPHTLINDIRAGIVSTKINIIMLNSKRNFDNNVSCVSLLFCGHRPTIFNMQQFRPIAHFISMYDRLMRNLDVIKSFTQISIVLDINILIVKVKCYNIKLINVTYKIDKAYVYV